jgi:hypothetical protein
VNRLNNVPQTYFTFHKEAVALANGNELSIKSGMNLANVYITGNPTGSTCVFEGQDEDGKWYPIKCANLTTLNLATSTNNVDEAWQVDLSAWNKFRVVISALVVGLDESITVKAKVVG